MIFRYTILYVQDVGRSLSFYEQALGLKRGFLHDSGDYGELVTGETKLAFSSRALMESLGKSPARRMRLRRCSRLRLRPMTLQRATTPPWPPGPPRCRNRARNPGGR